LNNAVTVAALIAALAATGWSGRCEAGWVEKVHAVPSRAGVEQPFVVATEKSLADQSAVKHLVVMFPGGAGIAGNAQEGIREQASCPVRESVVSLRGYLAEKLGASAAISAPGDQKEGLSIEWREGKEHMQDVGAAMKALMKMYPAAKVTVLGMSNGGWSAAHIAANMAADHASDWKERLRGVVLMSTGAGALRSEWMDALAKQKVPVLVVHHKRDSCLRYGAIEGEAKKHDFLSIDDRLQPRPNPVQPDCGRLSAHAFGGKQEAVYGAVVQWIETGKLTEVE
jgi:dienelactone hydrolase